MVEELGERAESVRNRAVDPSIDNMLKITNDGRKLALDQRMINLCSPMMKHQKVSVCADRVFDIWGRNNGYSRYAVGFLRLVNAEE